ncbi:MAG: hypothetical protein KGL39_36720 [Patescibacteria group bacterium]|nr:hypothetical protein [Patescibacteria group bacterium]
MTNAVVNMLPPLPANAAPVLTWMHATLALGLGWATHANWDRIRSGWLAVQSYCDSRQGGLITGCWRWLFGKPKT